MKLLTHMKVGLTVVSLVSAVALYQNAKLLQQYKKEPDDEQGTDLLKVTSNGHIHPIDELISKEYSKESSTQLILSILKNNSQPESYEEEIKTEDDILKETERCDRYGFTYNSSIAEPETTRKRRRIFWGSLIADDSWHAISAHAAEAYGLYHTVAFIESNTTQTMSTRETRFDEGSLNLKVLQSGIFGPKTSVTVDVYVAKKEGSSRNELLVENLQRDHILQRWKKNGMRPDDIGFVSDVDEVFTRDFLLALQTCDVPQFRPGQQDCFKPKIIASTLIFELTPECHNPVKRWHHPDVIIGECIDTIGDSNLHKPGLREPVTVGKRVAGYGLETGDYSKMPNTSMYPLWRPMDFRNVEGGNQYSEKPFKGHTAYHFHNFFDSFDVLRNKYKTYGHPVRNANSMSLGELQTDIDLGVRCIMKRPDDDLPKDKKYETGGFVGIEGRRPVIFENEQYRTARTRELKEMIEADEMKLKDES